MNGIEILSERYLTYGDACKWGIALFVTLAMIFFTLCLVFIEKQRRSFSFHRELKFRIVALLFGILSIVSLFGLGVWYYLPYYYHTKEYKIIANGATYEEITDKYEVISQEGKIITVREKESE